jgi:hypothetical protein
MTRLSALCLSFTYLVLAGCSSSPPANTAENAGQSNPSAPAAAATDDATGMPVPPAGAIYTLHCATFSAPTHIEDATRTKEMLIQSTKSNDWYVVHGADASDLYFGFYKTFEDRSQLAEYTRAQTDKVRVATLVDDNGDRLFPSVAFTPINTPDPPAPKEWDLANNPGYWTLQIAVYKGSPQRKQMAVDAVKGFRDHGVEAYYRHGPATSEVYIGSWPRSAVAEQQSSDAQSDDPNERLLVLPGPTPGYPQEGEYYDDQGRKTKVLMPKLEIVDASLKQATATYPYYYVNGEVMGHKVENPDHSWQTIPWPSYLIQVPHENADDTDTQAKTDDGSNPAAQPADSGNANSPVPGLGGLR